MNKLAAAFVTGLLQKLGQGVTRLSPSCYAEPLEYFHNSNKAKIIGYARTSV